MRNFHKPCQSCPAGFKIITTPAFDGNKNTRVVLQQNINKTNNYINTSSNTLGNIIVVSF